MSLAIALAIVAHFFYAIVFLADRFVVARAIRSPYVYTLLISILGISAFVFAPFGLHAITTEQTIAATLSGGTFMLGTLFFLSALQYQPTSHVAPFVGGLTPLFTFIVSWIFFREVLPAHAITAVVLLTIGSIIIAVSAKKEKTHVFSAEVLLLMVFSAVFYGVSYGAAKWVYEAAGFISGFIWIRVAAALTALVLLASPRARMQLRTELQRTRTRMEWLSLTNKFVGALALLLLNYAISLTSATVVNALQGVQYIFLIILVRLFGLRYPALVGEKLFGKNLYMLTSAVACILLGLIFLAL